MVLRTQDERNFEKVIQPSHALKILAPSLSYRLEWAKEWFYCAMPRRTKLTRPSSRHYGAERARRRERRGRRWLNGSYLLMSLVQRVLCAEGTLIGHSLEGFGILRANG